MATGIELLECYEKKLVEALAKTDLLKLSQDLQRYRVITSEMRKAIAALDHKRLDSRTRARYLLHLVCVRVKVDSANCTKFLTVLGEVDNERVAKIARALAQLHATKETPETEAGVAAENKLVDQDVGYLMDILAEVSHKWEEISISLKLPIASIEECRNARNNKLRLHKALTEWVCGNHKHARPPTLTELRETLASDIVQQWRLAGEIEERMMKVKISSTISPSVTDAQLSDCLQIQYESTNTKVADDKSALLEVQACPKESVSYQWMRDGQPLSESSAFSGTHSAMLLIYQASQGTEGDYCCHISRDSEHLTSSPVTVTVKHHKGKKCLLDLYAHLSEIPQDSWPLVSANAFVELSLIKATKVLNNDCNFFVEGEIEDVLERREKVEYEEAFGKYERGALVLVEGRPGSGKTTLAHKITKDWANGIILQNVRMLFLVSLRKDKKKSELFKTFFQSQSKVLQRKLEKSGGDRMCFILDGYDEYSPRHGDKSIINQLIHKAYLPHAMVIVTSRPVATAVLRPKANRRVEILGFTKKQFNIFVNTFPFENLTDSKFDAGLSKSNLMTYLKACTNVLNMCYLPINACIICFLYSQNLGANIPTTETEIYESLVIAIVLRKLRLKNPSARLHSLKDLHGDEKESFRLVCSLAFNMTVENQQIVHKLPMPLDSLNSSPFRDLLTIDRTAKLFGLEDVLTFLHLTLQEYLAAYHLAGLNADQQMEVIKLHSGKVHMLTMFKFYCGVTDMKFKMAQFDEISNVGADPLYMFHCAYETQKEIYCYRAMELMQGMITLGNGVLTPADFAILSYVISTASFMVIRMTILPCLLYEEFVDDKWKNRELDSTDSLSYSFEATITGTVSSLKLCTDDLFCTHISYNYKPQYMRAMHKLNELLGNSSIHDIYGLNVGMKPYIESSSDIFSSDSALPLAVALKQCYNLQDLQLIGNYKSIRSVTAITNIVKNCKDLQVAKILCVIPSSSAVVLAAGLQSSKYLQALELSHIDLSSDGAAALAKGLLRCSNLKSLNLDNCNISPEGAEAIASGLRYAFMEYLDISFNNIGDKGALALAKQFHHFNKLNISKNNIGSVGTKALARGLMKSPNLNSLHYDSNNIDSSDIVALAEGLSCCTGLEDLRLCHNDIGPDGAAALVQGLKSCKYLQFLKLQNCNLSLGGIVALAEGFICWRFLKILLLSDSGTISDGVAALVAGGLHFLTLLEELYLSNNGMDPNSAVALAEGLQYCPLLHILDMSKNMIGSAGAVALAGGLMCKQMKYVNISHNNVDIESVEALATLVQSCHLLKLDLSHNNIGSTGALCLITELINYSHPARLNLLVNGMSPKATKFFTRMLCRNKNLRVLLSSNSQASRTKTTGSSSLKRGRIVYYT